MYMVCRNKERGEAALSEIRSATGNRDVHLEVLPFLSEIIDFRRIDDQMILFRCAIFHLSAT